MPRVLVLTTDYPPNLWSGIGRAVSEQVEALAASGVPVRVLVCSGAGGPPGSASAQELAVRHGAADRCPVEPSRFSVVHLHSLGLSEIALEMKRRYGLRLVYTAHSLLAAELERQDAARFWCAVQAHLFRHCDHVVFLNHGDRGVAIQALPCLRDRSSVIPNCMRPRSGEAVPRDPNLILYAGRFTRLKGVDLLGRIVPRVLAAGPFHFVLAGGHGDAVGEGVAATLARRYPERCRTVGWLPAHRLETLLRRAALVLVPSRYEPHGMVALEAMRVGTPVLAAAVGGLAETLEPGAGGRLVSSHDADEWTVETLRLMGDARERARMEASGPDLVADRFGPDRWTGRMLEEAYA